MVKILNELNPSPDGPFVILSLSGAPWALQYSQLANCQSGSIMCSDHTGQPWSRSGGPHEAPSVYTSTQNCNKLKCNKNWACFLDIIAHFTDIQQLERALHHLKARRGSL